MAQRKGAADQVHRPSICCTLPRSLPSGWQRQAYACFFFFLSSLRPPKAAAAPAPNSRTPPGAGTGVPPLEDDVLEPPLVLVLELELVLEEVLVLELVLEPPDEVEVLELFDDLLLFEDFELLVDLVDFEKVPLLVDLQKMKQLLLVFVLLLNQNAFASVGAVAATPVVARETPITAALVILMYCIIAPWFCVEGRLTQNGLFVGTP